MTPVAMGFDRDTRMDSPQENRAPSLRGHRHSAGNALVMGEGDVAAVSAYDPQPDGRRYAACGDGVAAPVAEWIARRLAAVASGTATSDELAA